MTMNENIKRHLVDSATTVAVCTPVFAGLETLVAGMSNETSGNARIMSVGLVIAGAGSLYAKGRDYWQKRYTNGNGTTYKTDTWYALAVNMMASPFFYFACGSRSPKEILLGTGLALGVGALGGGPFGYCLDLSYALSGIKESTRIPKGIRNKSPLVKKGIGAACLGISAGITALIYAMNK